MSFALIIAAALSPASTAAPPAPAAGVDRSLSDTDRLTELRILVESALTKGEIDRATAAQLYLGIERTRRHMIHLGLQFGYRQRVRLRARIDRLYARLAESRMQAGGS